MSTTTLAVLAVAVLVVLAIAAFLYLRRQRTERLRRGFGPEYERAVRDHGDSGRAEAELEARERRVAALEIRPLDEAERERFAEAWRTVQTRFADDPPRATVEADGLVAEAMRARGYPVGDFGQRAADVSVHHPRVVEHYRAAHTLALLNEQGQATTEDLRKALVHYRALFEELLAAPTDESREERHERAA